MPVVSYMQDSAVLCAGVFVLHWRQNGTGCAAVGRTVDSANTSVWLLRSRASPVYGPGALIRVRLCAVELGVLLLLGACVDVNDLRDLCVECALTPDVVEVPFAFGYRTVKVIDVLVHWQRRVRAWYGR